jgi:hypothetical protein
VHSERESEAGLCLLLLLLTRGYALGCASDMVTVCYSTRRSVAGSQAAAEPDHYPDRSCRVSRALTAAAAIESDRRLQGKQSHSFWVEVVILMCVVMRHPGPPATCAAVTLLPTAWLPEFDWGAQACSLRPDLITLNFRLLIAPFLSMSTEQRHNLGQNCMYS